MGTRWHNWVDHTSEVQLQVGAESLAGLAVEAGQALSLLLLRGRRPSDIEPSGPPRTLEVESADCEALMVDWLNEILFVSEVDLWVPVEFEIEEASPTRLKASARGVTVEDPPSNVKAATFHGLSVTAQNEGDDDGGLQAEVIFDV